MNIYPSQTVEFQPVTVTVNGAAVTSGVKFSTVPRSSYAGPTQPGTWVNPTSLSGQIGIMVQGLTVGIYDVWAQVTSPPEIPVILCGSFQVT